MPSARFYREQAQLLLSWALSTSDPDHATKLTTRAIELLIHSNEPDDDRVLSWNDAVNEFNNHQMRSRPVLQQQQVQPKKGED